MSQVYLVRHGETCWNVAGRIQGHSNSALTDKGIQQAYQVAERVKSLGVTHVISSDLGRTRQTADIIARYCGCDVTLDARLRELNMGVLEKRHLTSLNAEEEGWRQQIIDGSENGRIPQGESLAEVGMRMQQALNSCLDLPVNSCPLLVSHGIALGVLISTILGLPPYAKRRLRLRNCSLSRLDHQHSDWLAAGWVVETAGETGHLTLPALDELQR